MSGRTAAADVVLVLGILAELICVAGVLWMRDVFDRLHFTGAATTVGPILVGVAVGLAGVSTVSALTQSLGALAALVVLGPVLTHLTGRSVHRLRGRPEPDATEER